MLLIAGLTLLSAATLMLAAVWWGQERLVFQPPADTFGDAAEGRIDYAAADGQPLFGLLVGEPAKAAGVLVAFHGNGDVAMRQIPWARQVQARTGWAVLLAEYRGYGGLPGRPTGDGVRLDAQAAHAAAVRMPGVDPARIAVYGHSLGSAIAVQLAADLAASDSGAAADATPVRALLLESPFSSVRAMAGRFGASGVVLYHAGLVRFTWDTEARVRTLRVPVAVAHGARDRLVPAALGRSVHAAAAVPGPLLIVEQAGHNDVAWHAGDAYWEWVSRALAGTPR